MKRQHPKRIALEKLIGMLSHEMTSTQAKLLHGRIAKLKKEIKQAKL